MVWRELVKEKVISILIEDRGVRRYPEETGDKAKAVIEKTMDLFEQHVGSKRLEKYTKMGKAGGLPLKIVFRTRLLNDFSLFEIRGGDYLVGKGIIWIYGWKERDPLGLAQALTHEFGHYIQDVIGVTEAVSEEELEREAVSFMTRVGWPLLPLS